MERQRIQGTPRPEEVTVRIDEAGQQSAVPEIHHAGRRVSKGHYLVEGTGRGDRLAPNRHRVDRWLVRVHRDDVIAEENHIRERTDVGWRCSTAASDQQADTKHQQQVLHQAVRLSQTGWLIVNSSDHNNDRRGL